MKKLLLATAFAIGAIIPTTHAQLPYTVTTTLNQPYTPLTAGTVLNRSVWTGDSSYTAPIGFTFRMAGKNLTSIDLVTMNLLSTTTASSLSGFGIVSAELDDRGYGTATSRSPLRYSTTGNAGSRIFKLELSNAGFATEHSTYSTNVDSMSYQVWLYEGTNITELRFGPSHISHFEDYFGLKYLCAYIKDLNFLTQTFDKIYTLDGNANNPGIDSITLQNPDKGLGSMPANGTVYRFTPRANTTGINNTQRASLAKVYPTQCTGELVVEHGFNEPLSYSVIALSGRRMQEGTLSAGRDAVDVTGYPQGTYFIRLSNNRGETDIRRFVKM